MNRRIVTVIATAVLAASVAAPGHAAPVTSCPGTERWVPVGANSFTGMALIRSQGVTSDDHGWIFSWQGGISRTDDRYHMLAYNTFAPTLFTHPQIGLDGTNHIGPTHIGDGDEDHGVFYAPEEDGNESLGPVGINQPEYQHPTVALYDAKTLLFTGVTYELPLEVNGQGVNRDGVPWVGINHATGEVYDTEWGNPNNRINVFDLQMHFKRFLDLQPDPSLGAGFRLNRIQGAEVIGNALYAARDDDEKTIYKVDLATGVVTKAFAIAPSFPSELEGLAVRATPDGALLHVLIVVHRVLPVVGEQPIGVQFLHYALRCS